MVGRITVLSRRRFLQLSGACATSVLVSGFPDLLKGEEVGESRAIFDEGLNWINPKAAHTVCERIKRAGFNTFMPCVWHGRGVVWPSNLAPWDSHNVQSPGYDPLGNLVETAKQYDLEIHPWLTLGLRQRHGFLPEFADSPDSESFDWHRPAFRNFAISLVKEIVERYPVAGINLDFVRFDSPRPGHESEQEAVVGDAIRQISRQARAINPLLVLSVCAAPWHPTIRQYGQDSPKWADEGIVDVIYSMQYDYSPDVETFRQIQARMKNPAALVMLVANYDQSKLTKDVRPRDAKRVSELLQQSRSVSMRNGVGLYLYSMLNEEQISLLQQTVFHLPAKPDWGRRLKPSRLKSPTITIQ